MTVCWYPLGWRFETRHGRPASSRGYAAPFVHRRCPGFTHHAEQGSMKDTLQGSPANHGITNRIPRRLEQLSCGPFCCVLCGGGSV